MVVAAIICFFPRTLEKPQVAEALRAERRIPPFWIIAMNRNMLVRVLVGAAIVIGLSLRAWWLWPEELQGGPHVGKLERRGRTYSLQLHHNSSLSDIVDLRLFEGYSPSKHLEFLERLADRPSKVVEDGGHDHYVEYVVQRGRMQFHSGDDGEGGLAYWLEFVPSDLPIDSFLDKNVAISLDITRAEFKVWIPMKEEQMYMTIMAKNRMVDRIVWSED